MGCVASAAEALKPTLEEGVYHISPKHCPEKVLGCAGGETENGTKIVLWEADGTDNQKFKVVKVGPGGLLYAFKPVHAEDKALDNPNAEEQCHLWEFGDGSNTNQQWLAQDAGDGSYFLLKKTEDNKPLALDVAESSTENGAKVYTWKEVTRADNQKWLFKPVGEAAAAAPAAPELAEGKYKISPKHATPKVLGCAGGETDNGTKIVLWDQDDSPNQTWNVTKNGEFYMFKPTHAEDKALDNPNAEEQCHLWDLGDGQNANQKWKLTQKDDGWVVTKEDGLILDIAESSTDNGAVCYTWKEATGADNQTFLFIPA